MELGLLKGRHPLLKDVDVAINPSKGLSLVEGVASGKDAKVKDLLNLSQPKAVNGYAINPMPGTLEDSDTAISFRFRPRGDSQEDMEFKNKQSQRLDNVLVPQANFDESERVQENEASAEDSERGQVLQAAQVIMNMLDMTMPGTLREEEKKKVILKISQILFLHHMPRKLLFKYFTYHVIVSEYIYFHYIMSVFYEHQI